MGTRTSGNVTQNLTGSAPTLATDGVDLSGAEAARVMMSIASGTFTGGYLKVYFYEPSVGWFENQGLRITVAANGASAAEGYADFPILADYGRVAVVTSGVTVSAGQTEVTTRLTVHGSRIP
jgi:hypothetical protein